MTPALRLVARFKREAIIRKEKGKGYCVKSPSNPDWNGGCYPSKGEAEKRLEQVEYFKNKSGRQIPIDKRFIGHFVEHDLMPKVERWLKRQPQDEPIGAQSMGTIAQDRLMLDMSDGRTSINLIVAVGAQSSGFPGAAVLGGGFAKSDRVIALYMNGAITPKDYLSTRRLQPLHECTYETCLPYGLFSILIHEATHAVDLSLKEIEYSPSDVIEQGEKAWGPYVNDPNEVRAFMQQVVDEVVRSAGKIKSHFSGQKLVEVALKMSTTWSLVGKHLNPSNKAKILKAVYLGLDEAGLVTS